VNSNDTAGTETEVAILAGGCFWCLDAVCRDLVGVDSVECGYIGGAIPHPSYEAVCTGTTGHAEAVRIRFRPAVIRYEDLLEVFFAIHDPTTLNRQGADVGTQYRSEIFATTAGQRTSAVDAIERLGKSGEHDRPIVTAVSDAGVFFEAEDYHEDYFRNNPYSGYCRAVIGPKVAKFRKHFAGKLKDAPSR
jgi:peptide-methionine (S)-S-oxide reductase